MKRVWKDFELKNKGDYRDLLFVICYLLLFESDIFENFCNKCIETYELDPAQFLSTPGLGCQACLKMTAIKLKLLFNIDMLRMVEKGIRGGIFHAIHLYANKKYLKDYNQN